MRTYACLAAIAVSLAIDVAAAQTTTRALRLTEELRIDGAEHDLASGNSEFWLGRDGRMAVFDAPDGRSGSSVTRSDSAIIVMARDGSLERRLAEVWADSAMAIIEQPGTNMRFAPVPFRHPKLIAATPSGEFLAVARASAGTSPSGTLRLTVLRSTGDTVVARSHPYTSVAVTKRMADSAYARMDSIYSRMPQADNTAILRMVRERIPAVVAPFARIDVGSDGTMWLRRNMLGSAPAEYAVFAPTGDHVGTLKLPRSDLFVRAVSRSTLWATETDADGFMSVVRFRVEGP